MAPDGTRPASPQATENAQASADLPKLTVLLAAPRGFCAGVDRAIQIVEQALERFGSPVYVRHEIVHNRFVVESLEAKGAIFVDELDAVPNDAPVIFSAHGVPKSVPNEAERRNLLYIDATCPLVSKVHREAERHHRDGFEVVLIGHRNHPEVIGTIGQLPDGAVTLIETVEQAETIEVSNPEKVAYVTQTTLSVDDTAEIVGALRARFPAIAAPRREDICYATTNRQSAVKTIAARCDGLLVIGAPNSSNSLRLVEVAERHGCRRAALIQRAADLDWNWLTGIGTLGLTAGASAPEILVAETIDRLRTRYDVRIKEVAITKENTVFKLPRMLNKAPAS